MYSRFSRSLVNVKKLENQFRNYSAYSGCTFSESKNFFGSKNPQMKSQPTDKIISGCFMSRRQFSVSGFRFQDGGPEIFIVDTAVNNSLKDSIEILTPVDIPETVSSTVGSSEAAVTTATDSSEAVTTLSKAASAVNTSGEETKEILLDFLPEKPLPLDPSAILGEPSFDSLGLGSWWPSGRLQLFMEYLHVDIGNFRKGLSSGVYFVLKSFPPPLFPDFPPFK